MILKVQQNKGLDLGMPASVLLPELPDCSLLLSSSQETLLKPVFIYLFIYFPNTRSGFLLPPPPHHPLMQYNTVMVFLLH